MKKIIIWGPVPILLLLDWLALDDMTTGNEPNYNGEYAILKFSFVIFGLITLSYFRSFKKDF